MFGGGYVVGIGADDGSASRTFRLGFVIVRRDQTVPWLPDLRYRGLDRLPFVPFLSEIDPDLANLWRRYFDARDEGLIGRDLEVARSAMNDLGLAGAETEILYAEAIIVPPLASVASENLEKDHERSLAWLDSHSAGVPPVPSGFAELGHDVCTPIPDYHSAIVQPGLIPHDSALAESLNEAGLIDESAAASEFMHMANSAKYSLSDLISVIRIFAKDAS